MTVIQKAQLEKRHEKHSQINKYVGLSTSASEVSSALFLIDGNKIFPPPNTLEKFVQRSKG